MVSKNIRRASCWLVGVLVLAVTGCGGDGGGGNGSSLGSLGVSLTDAPACGFNAVNVTVDKVRVHQSGSANENAAGWTTIALVPPRKINLLDLNDPTQGPTFAMERLGETPLEAGHYTQVRLVLVENSGAQPLANSVVLSGTATEIPLDTPSGIQSGIKLIHQFTVNAGQHVDLLLDFDACQSIVKTGNAKYKLKPVVKVIPFELNGIRGYVDMALLGNNILVSAQTNGSMVRATVPNATGHFFLAHLGAGRSYDVVVTADGHTTAVIADVPVQTTVSTTTISTQAAPIVLSSSPVGNLLGTVTLHPATDDAAVYNTVKQTLTAGPTVTVKSQPAAVSDGSPVGDYSYSILLPKGAPAFGHYSPSLPIPLSATQQGAVAGKYTHIASATGYVSKSSGVDITSSDVSQNLTLIP